MLLVCEIAACVYIYICERGPLVCICSTPLLCVIQFTTPREAGRDQGLRVTGTQCEAFY